MRWLFAAVLASSCVGLAAEQTVTVPAGRDGFRFERDIIVRHAGPNRLDVDLALLIEASPSSVVDEPSPGRAGSRPVARGGLADLRLFDAGGREVPYLLIDPRISDPEWIGAAPLAIAGSERASGLEVDLGRLQPVDLLRLDGLPPPFLKRVALQGSGDRVRWTVLSRESTMFDLPDRQLARREIDFAPGEYRYLRLLWDDTSSARLPLPARVWVRKVGASGAPAPALGVPLDVERRPSEPRRSRFRLRFPAPRLPVVALEIESLAANLHREAVVHQSVFSGQDAEPQALGRGLLRRTTTGGLSASELRIPIAPPSQAAIELVVDDGDNPPFDLRRATAVCAALPWIYFEVTSSHQIVARYGRTGMEAPQYDLEARRSASLERTAAHALWGPPRATVEAPAPVPAPPVSLTGAPVDPAEFRYARVIPGGRSGALVALPVDAAMLAHSAGPSGRFRDVRVLDGASHQIPYLIERLDEPLVVALPSPEREDGLAADRPFGSVSSVYRLRLPFPGLPPGTLALTTPARVFERVVHVEVDDPAPDRRGEARRRRLATATWRHLDSLAPASALTLALPALRQAQIVIVVDDGDNSTLPLGAAQLLLPGYRLRFYRPSVAPLRLVYGRAGTSEPRYDLRLLSAAVLSETPEETAAGEEHEQPGAGPPSPLTLHPALFYGLLVAAVVVIAGIIVRLLRQARG